MLGLELLPWDGRVSVCVEGCFVVVSLYKVNFEQLFFSNHLGSLSSKDLAARNTIHPRKKTNEPMNKKASP